MGEYRLSPRAERDLEEIWAYSARRWSVEQADRYANDLIDMIERLAEEPQQGRSAEHVRRGYLKYPIGSHVIFYRRSTTGIDVIRILHQRMNIEAHLRKG
jgi:toxin ParE1/3/4